MDDYNTQASVEQYRLLTARETGLEFGRGSCAAVVEVDYKGLRCAGKKIHRILYEGQVDNLIRRFEEECRLLSQLRHPHIVQFLGIYFEVDTNAPVLVMEFLPTTLTQCLDHYGVMPEEINCSILQDVAIGLRYLHDRRDPIIHRDLSANNVLLMADMRAKISHLGVAKIMDTNPNRMSTMTKTPGTQCYMPPETMVLKPRYGIKVDIFSYGVMMVHALSGQWPFPGEAVRVNPRNPNNPNDVIGVTEFDRRKEYIDLIGYEHPLISLIQRCLSNSPSHRPTSSEVHQRVNAVAADHPLSFANRVEMMDRIKVLSDEKERVQIEKEAIRVEKDTAVRAIERLSAEVEELHSSTDRHHKYHLIEKESLHAQLSHVKAENEHLVRVIAIKDEEVKTVKNNNHYNMQVLDRKHRTESETCEQKHVVEIQSLKQQINIIEKKHAVQLATLEDEQRIKNEHHQTELEAKTRELAVRADCLATKSNALETLERQLEFALDLDLSQNHSIPNLFTPRANLVFSECANLPTMRGQGTAVVSGHIVYVGYGGTKFVYKYSITIDKWDSLPIALVEHFALGHLNGKILTIGGKMQSKGVIPDIYEFDGASKQWVKSTSIPPMPTARELVTTVSWSSPPALIVCGGRGESGEPMSVVEIYTTAQWSTATPLPTPSSLMSQAIYGDTIFFMGGKEESTLGSCRKTVFYVSVAQLLASCVSELPSSQPRLDELRELWHFLPDVPHYRCSAAFLNGCLLAIGGQKEALIGGPVYSSVYAYCPHSSSWLKVGDLPQPRSYTTAVTLLTRELLVIGGLSTNFLKTSTVYKCLLSLL